MKSDRYIDLIINSFCQTRQVCFITNIRASLFVAKKNLFSIQILPDVHLVTCNTGILSDLKQKYFSELSFVFSAIYVFTLKPIREYQK